MKFLEKSVIRIPQEIPNGTFGGISNAAPEENIERTPRKNNLIKALEGVHEAMFLWNSW